MKEKGNIKGQPDHDPDHLCAHLAAPHFFNLGVPLNVTSNSSSFEHIENAYIFHLMCQQVLF